MSSLKLLGSEIRKLTQFRLLDIDRLYHFTRDHTSDLRPWMCDDRGVAVVLDARYEFVELYLRKRRTLILDEIQRTEYWKFICAPLDARPRDGGRTWQYADPASQVNRFMALIDSLVDKGYLASWRACALDQFEEFAPPHGEVDGQGSENRVVYAGRRFAGFITVIRHGEYYSALNGLHRLAVLKYLQDVRAFKRSRVLTMRVG